MSICIGYDRNKSGEIDMISEVTFLQYNNNDFNIVKSNIIDNKAHILRLYKGCNVPHTISDNQYTFMGKDSPKFMGGCVFS